MRRYDKDSQETVESAMQRRNEGTLKSGKQVTSRKQAIAIGLSEARAKGDKVPDAPAARKTTRRSTKRK